MVLLGKLAEEGRTQRDGKGFLCGATPMVRRRQLSAAEDAFLWKWATDKMPAP